MSIRLSILLSQGNGQESELEGQLVVDLLGATGMDLSIVTALSRLTPDHTDRLVIESLTGDFALLGWESSAALVEHCQRLGVDGTRAPHRLDPDVAAVGGGRKIYAIDLRGRAVAEVRQALDQILKSRQTATFNLLPASPGSVPATPPAAGSGQTTAAAGAGAPIPLAAEPHDSAPRGPADGSAIDSTAESSAADDAADALLESLVDDLNDSNI